MANPSRGKVAIVGLGRMGAIHYDALHHAGFDVIAGFDERPLAREEFIRARPVEVHSMESFEETINRLGVEGLILATTTPARFGIFQLAVGAEALEWIVFEKPVSSSLNELSQVIELARQFNLRVAVNHQMMFLPQYELVRPFFERGDFGTFESMVVTGANFGLANNVSHYFEAFRFLSGTEIATVSSFLDSELQASHRGSEFWDFSGAVFAESTEGKKLYVDFQAGAGHGIVVVYNFAFGKVIVDELTGFVRASARKAEDRDLPTGRYGLEGVSSEFSFSSHGLVGPTSRLLTNVATGEVPYPGLSAASHSLRCVVASIASAEKGSVPQRTDSLSLASEAFRVFPWS